MTEIPEAESFETAHEVGLRVNAAGFSVPSERHPDRNEDAFFADEDSLAVGVFDGLGGHPGSEAASMIARDTIAEYLRQTPTKASKALGFRAIRQSLWNGHKAIVAHQETAEKDKDADVGKRVPSMATTAVIAKYFEYADGTSHVVHGHIGDSRAYLLRDGQLSQLTLDDSISHLPGTGDDYHMTQQAMRLQERRSNVTSDSELDSDELRAAFEYRNLINNALGQADNPPRFHVSNIGDVQIDPGDRMLFTSDGIHDNLTTIEIETILLENPETEIAVGALVHAARERSRTKHLRAKPDDMTAAIMAF